MRTRFLSETDDFEEGSMEVDVIGMDEWSG